MPTMQSNNDDDSTAWPPAVDGGARAPNAAKPPLERSATARGGSGGHSADSIGHAHQWLVRGDASVPRAAPTTPTAAGSPSRPPASPGAPTAPLRRREPSSGFPAIAAERSEESSPFAGQTLDRPSRPGQQVTNPGGGYGQPQTTPATGYLTPVSDSLASSALLGLPIQRPRVLSAHGVSFATQPGPTSQHGAVPAAAVQALPDIPTYATAVHPHDDDVVLAFAALPGGALSATEAAHLCARMWRQSIEAGRLLFGAEDRAECAYMVANGLGRIEVPGPIGMTAISPLRTGDLVGVAALSGDVSYGHAVVAASDLVVFSLRREEFLKLCAEAPRLAQRLLAAGLVQSSRRIRSQAERMTAYAQLDIPEAVAATPGSQEPQGSRLGRLLARLAGGKENG